MPTAPSANAPTADHEAGQSLRYRAFLSYSHRDGAITERLHRRLEAYSVPRALRADAPGQPGVPANLRPVFRDRDELSAAARLSSTIEAALDQSQCLIVVCSPAAAASQWVEAEIRYFRRRYPHRPVFAFVVAGDPGADPRTRQGVAAFPLALALEDVDDDQAGLGEPIAADARVGGDGYPAACLKLIAGLLGVRYDQLRQREQRRAQVRWMLAAGVSLALTLVFAYLAWQATVARDQARAAQSMAELELESEQQTRGFLLSVFQLADANESRGNEVTVREVLDHAVQRIDRTQFKRPEIRSRFLATLGQAYASLGLNLRSTTLLQSSIDALSGKVIDPKDRAKRIDNRIELAEVFYDMGNYDQALAQFEAIRKTGDQPSVNQQVRAANLRGDIESYREHDAEAAVFYHKALALIDPAAMTREEYALTNAKAEFGLAQLAHFAGDYAKAERGFATAMARLIPVVGQTHPLAISLAVSRGSSAYAGGDRATARSVWKSALTAARTVYDELSPVMGTIKNNLGLLLLEDGDLKGAEPLLREALASDRKHRSKGFDDLAFPLANLGYTRFFQGDPVEAEQLFQEALPIAKAHDHTMTNAILNGLAEINCSRGDVAIGIEFADAAVADSIKRHGAEHWRTAQARLTAAYCRVVAGESVDRPEMVKLANQIRKKWGPASAFTLRADVQARAEKPGH